MSQASGLGSKLKSFWSHPAGPKTIHFWAPTFKWGISLANVADFKRPADQVHNQTANLLPRSTKYSTSTVKSLLYPSVLREKGECPGLHSCSSSA